MMQVIPKMDLGVVEMGFIFCGKHPLLVTRTQMRDQGPSCLKFTGSNVYNKLAASIGLLEVMIFRLL